VHLTTINICQVYCKVTSSSCEVILASKKTASGSQVYTVESSERLKVIQYKSSYVKNHPVESSAKIKVFHIYILFSKLSKLKIRSCSHTHSLTIVSKSRDQTKRTVMILRHNSKFNGCLFGFRQVRLVVAATCHFIGRF